MTIVSSLLFLHVREWTYIVSLNLASIHMQPNTRILTIRQLLIIKHPLPSGHQFRPKASLILMERKRITRQARNRQIAPKRRDLQRRVLPNKRLPIKANLLAINLHRRWPITRRQILRINHPAQALAVLRPTIHDRILREVRPSKLVRDQATSLQVLKMRHEPTENITHDLQQQAHMFLQHALVLQTRVQSHDLIIAEIQGLERRHEPCRLGSLKEDIFVLDNILDRRHQNRALQLNHVDLERRAAAHRRLLMVFDLIDLDSDTVICTRDLFRKLFWRRLAPVVVPAAAVLTFKEDFRYRVGAKVGVFGVGMHSVGGCRFLAIAGGRGGAGPVVEGFGEVHPRGDVAFPQHLDEGLVGLLRVWGI